MKQNTPIWGSVSILTGVVIAILSLARGAWMLPLLIAAFAAWGLWLIWTQFLPARRVSQLHQQTESTGQPDAALAQTLLHHVNYRVSACLQASYPDAKWEWMMRDPALFVAQGGTGRIKLYGVPEYDFADVTVDRSGKLACSLVKLAPMQSAGDPSGQPPMDPQVWYEAQGRETLERLVTDLDSRGHSSLTLKEDGSICTCPGADGDDMLQGSFASFPAKVYWPRLAEVLEQEGLTAAVQDTCIVVTW